MIRTAVFTTLAQAQAVAGQWEKLTVDGASSIYTSPSWCLAAWRHLPDLGSPLLVAAVVSGDLLGLLPLTAGPRGICWAASPLGDEHDVLINPAVPNEPVIDSLLQAVRLRLVPETTANLQHLRPDGRLVRAVSSVAACPAPTLTLQPPDQEFGALACIPGWSRRHRRDLRRAHRRLSELGAVRYRFVSRPDRLPAALAAFTETRLRSWQERGRLHELPSIDRHPRFPGFISAAGSSLASQGRCFLAMLLLDGTPIAQALFFRTRSALLLYMSTFEVWAARYSPSHLLLAHAAANAISEGINLIELGRGDEPYKFDLGAAPRYLRDVVLSA